MSWITSGRFYHLIYLDFIVNFSRIWIHVFYWRDKLFEQRILTYQLVKILLIFLPYFYSKFLSGRRNKLGLTSISNIDHFKHSFLRWNNPNIEFESLWRWFFNKQYVGANFGMNFTSSEVQIINFRRLVHWVYTKIFREIFQMYL